MKKKMNSTTNLAAKAAILEDGIKMHLLEDQHEPELQDTIKILVSFLSSLLEKLNNDNLL